MSGVIIKDNILKVISEYYGIEEKLIGKFFEHLRSYDKLLEAINLSLSMDIHIINVIETMKKLG